MSTPADVQMSPLRVAVLGAGLFVRDSYTLVLRGAAARLRVAAVGSRSLGAARDIAEALRDTHGDVMPFELADDAVLDALLGLRPRDDVAEVDAFIVALPVPVQDAFVQRCLVAKKHVLSEKPLAPTLESARALCAAASAAGAGVVFNCAENWRYEPAWREATRLIGALGALVSFHMTVHTCFRPDNKYYQTEWRRVAEFKGSFFADGGVHYAAALRMALGIEQFDRVHALTSRANAEFPQPDTLNALLAGHRARVDGKPVHGTLDLSFSATGRYVAFNVVGEHGRVYVGSHMLELPDAPADQVAAARAASADFTAIGYWVQSSGPAGASCTFVRFGGLPLELDAFLDDCDAPSRAASDNTPAEGFADLALIHALIDSARSGGDAVAPERL